MTLLVRNLQNSVKFNLQKMRSDVVALRRILKVERYDLGVICVEDKKMQEMNRIYRGKNETTDVLSFPAHENLKPGKLPDPWSDLADLGDIFLGMGYIDDHCKKTDTELEKTLPVVIAHGLCHLLGYDHKTREQWREMHQRELHILEQYHKLTGEKLKPLTSWSEHHKAPEYRI